MSRISRVTTNNGDYGETSLATGRKIAKTEPIIRALGSTDELNSCIGLLNYYLNETDNYAEASLSLAEVQQSLFDIGAILAMEGQYEAKNLSTAIETMTETIASLNGSLPPLAEFVVPGGNLLSSQSHICRTIARRAETDLWVIFENKDASNPISMSESLNNAGVFLNRLSDYFFVLARTFTHSSEEKQWRGPDR
jgi:cob(I)alamin adenosyltransferase